MSENLQRFGLSLGSVLTEYSDECGKDLSFVRIALGSKVKKGTAVDLARLEFVRQRQTAMKNQQQQIRRIKEKQVQEIFHARIIKGIAGLLRARQKINYMNVRAKGIFRNKKMKTVSRRQCRNRYFDEAEQGRKYC